MARRVDALGTQHDPERTAVALGFCVVDVPTCGGPDAMIGGHVIMIARTRRKYSRPAAIAHELGHRCLSAHARSRHSESEADEVAALVFPAVMMPPKKYHSR